MYLGQYLGPTIDVGPAITANMFLSQMVRWCIVPPTALFFLNNLIMRKN